MSVQTETEIKIAIEQYTKQTLTKSPTRYSPYDYSAPTRLYEMKDRRTFTGDDSEGTLLECSKWDAITSEGVLLNKVPIYAVFRVDGKIYLFGRNAVAEATKTTKLCNITTEFGYSNQKKLKDVYIIPWSSARIVINTNTQGEQDESNQD